MKTPNIDPDIFGNSEELEAHLLAVNKLHKDLMEAMATVDPDQARFLVDLYYQMQDFRKRLDGQIRAQKKRKEATGILEWFKSQFFILENQAKNALHRYAKSHQAGRWALDVDGIGPVIAAGLLAHIQVDRDNSDPKKRMNNPSKLQRFAGLDPTIKWQKGQKRPWNPKLKTLCFLLGESFVKLRNKEDAFYPPKFVEFKQEEISRNDSGGYTQQALRDKDKYEKGNCSWQWVNGCYPAGMCQELQDIPNNVPAEVIARAEEKGASVSKATSDWCKEERQRMLEDKLLKPGEGQPMLPPSQIHSRARRRVAKIFLVHMWEEIWVEKYNEEPVDPWIFVHGGHSTRIYRPNPNRPTGEYASDPLSNSDVPVR